MIYSPDSPGHVGRCANSGTFSGSSAGHMDCSDAKGVPLAISIKPATRK
jgi:hypothetical protein